MRFINVGARGKDGQRDHVDTPGKIKLLASPARVGRRRSRQCLFLIKKREKRIFKIRDTWPDMGEGGVAEKKITRSKRGKLLQ